MALEWPKSFAERVYTQLGAVEWAAFQAVQQQPAPVSVRYNPRKPWPVLPGAEHIPWCEGAYWLPERPLFAASPAWHAGAYYVQEASSMMLGAALQQWLAERAANAGGPQEPILALDLCAAPGGKTTLLQGLLPNDAMIVANETVARRAGILHENLLRWGAHNVLITNAEVEQFLPLKGYADIVLVDAPCSGEGLWRRQPEAMHEWSTDAVQACATRQQGLLQAAGQLLKPGGLLLYSTCTFAPPENAQVVQQLFAAMPGYWRALTVPEAEGWGAQPVAISAGATGYQCWPHRVRGEGFFWTALVRTDVDAATPTVFEPRLPKPDKLPADVAAALAVPPHWLCHWHNDRLLACSSQLLHWQAVLQQLRIRLVASGVCIAERERSLVQIGQAAVWCPFIDVQLPHTELDLPLAQRYLKGEALPAHTARGAAVAAHNGLRLGLLKGAGNRWNNLYPKPFRLRMDVPTDTA